MCMKVNNYHTNGIYRESRKCIKKQINSDSKRHNNWNVLLNTIINSSFEIQGAMQNNNRVFEMNFIQNKCVGTFKYDCRLCRFLFITENSSR